jgi:hypothetical protein
LGFGVPVRQLGRPELPPRPPPGQNAAPTLRPTVIYRSNLHWSR